MIFWCGFGLIVLLAVLAFVKGIFGKQDDVREAKRKARELVEIHFPDLPLGFQMSLLQKSLLSEEGEFSKTMSIYERWNIAVGCQSIMDEEG